MKLRRHQGPTAGGVLGCSQTQPDSGVASQTQTSHDPYPVFLLSPGKAPDRRELQSHVAARGAPPGKSLDTSHSARASVERNGTPRLVSHYASLRGTVLALIGPASSIKLLRVRPRITREVPRHEVANRPEKRQEHGTEEQRRGVRTNGWRAWRDHFVCASPADEEPSGGTVGRPPSRKPTTRHHRHRRHGQRVRRRARSTDGHTPRAAPQRAAMTTPWRRRISATAARSDRKRVVSSRPGCRAWAPPSPPPPPVPPPAPRRARAPTRRAW